MPRGVLYNCYLYVKSIYPSLPPTATIRANVSNEPAEVAVFNYSGTPHYAIVEEVGTSTITIVESNWNAGEITRRTVPIADQAFIGFFDL